MVNVNFKPVDPDEIPNFHKGPTGRVSYPILKSFMETGYPVAQIDRSEMTEKQSSNVGTSLNYYIRKHKLPIKMFRRGGEVYLARTDVTSDGKVPEASIDQIMNETAKAQDRSSGPVIDIDEEVEGRFE